MTNKKIDPICRNCLLYDSNKGECKVVILFEGKKYHLPVLPDDRCHMDELGIEVKQVRWWVEDKNGQPTDGNGIVKIEYPVDFFNKNLES